jgi:hypothetical protein
MLAIVAPSGANPRALPAMLYNSLGAAAPTKTRRHEMIRYAALATLILLSGCAGLLPSAQMSAEQLKAVASDSNANATVVTYTGTGGQGVFSTLNTDKGSLGSNGGSATVKPNGEISIVVNPRPEPWTLRGPTPLANSCAPLAYERSIDGTCNEVRRNATTCGINSGARVDASKCPAP